MDEIELQSKIAQVHTFLNSTIITDELKNTPLILFFICKLSIDNELATITNRANLYETITKKIITEHNLSK
jgi:hypothetical protein